METRIQARLIQRVCPMCRKPHTPAISCCDYKRAAQVGTALTLRYSSEELDALVKAAEAEVLTTEQDSEQV